MHRTVRTVTGCVGRVIDRRIKWGEHEWLVQFPSGFKTWWWDGNLERIA